MTISNSIKHTIINHLNTFILDEDNKININILKGSGNDQIKKFSVKYNNYKYTFYRLADDKNKLILYSYDNKNTDCVTLTIEKNKKSIVLTSFGKSQGCFKEETNIGSNLLKITLKMIEKYKDHFNINKIILSDNSEWKCKTGEVIDMAKMKTLLTGHTWYGAYGFRPIDKNDYNIDKTANKIYDNNLKIMNTLRVKDIDLKKYLLKINKKFPDELEKYIIHDICSDKKIREKILKDFLSGFFDKLYFDNTCKYLKTFYKELYDDIGLKIPGHLYGKDI